jgi:hypothetical protein
MQPPELQSLCEQGQQQLMEMHYLSAEATLAAAEQQAWQAGDFDTLARLYMPLQEARRQRRQRCGEGIVRLDLLASGPEDLIDPRRILSEYPHGQLLIAGWGSIAPSVEFRKLDAIGKVYVETFLAAVYPIIGGSRAVVIVPREDLLMPPPREQSIDRLLAELPPHCIVLHENEIPRGPQVGTPTTYGQTMAIWERLHAPYLAAADMQIDPIRKIEHYRKTIAVDYACELAHQRVSAAARELSHKK